MRSRNAQTSNNTPFQTVDFNTLKRKGEPPFQLQINNDNPSQLILQNFDNVPLFLAAASAILYPESNSRNKNKQKLFSDFSVTNVPKQFINFQHENTLQQIIKVMKSKCRSFNDIQQAIYQYPVCEFALYCFGRSIVQKFIEEKIPKDTTTNQKLGKSGVNSVSSMPHIISSSRALSMNNQTETLDLHGNQFEVIEDYDLEIRGNVLQCLCDALEIQMTLVLKDVCGEQFIESYGNITYPLKIGIKSEEDRHICEVCYQKVVPKLQQNNSTHHIQRSIKQMEHIDSTTEDMTAKLKSESKSVNKDHLGRCKTCGSRNRFCQCDRRKGVTPRPAAQKHGIFDGLNINNVGRSARREDNRKKCYCNRTVCVCRK